MLEPKDRLRIAREQAGYATAADAARAMGVKAPTYTHHENGTNGLSRSGARYAKFFRVSLDWLLEERGAMNASNPTIPLVGLVGAGAEVIPISGDRSDHMMDFLEMHRPEKLLALRVRGDSQYPRYLDGEIILFTVETYLPRSLLNEYAVVDISDGRRLLKLIARGSSDKLFTLRSHNAPDIEDANIIEAHRVVGTLNL